MFRLFRTLSHQEPPDEELLGHYQRTGEAHYLGQLYGRYLPMVYGLCLKILRDTHAAEDAVMSIYEELLRKAQSHSVQTFRGWLYVLARNYCLMELRRQKRAAMHVPLEENLSNGANSIATATDLWEEIGTEEVSLRECLEGLPEKQRISLHQFYFEERSYREIAEAMDEAIGRVRSYIQNGRRNLRLCLEKKKKLPS